MRVISTIIIHCSAVRPWQQSSVTDIDRWHLERGWRYGCGYHYVVRRDGSIEKGRPLERAGAHCKDHNRHSIGICYEGGLDMKGNPSDTRTPEQRVALRVLLEQLHGQFPRAVIVGHHVFNPMKSCPCFDAQAEYADLQPERGV